MQITLYFWASGGSTSPNLLSLEVIIDEVDDLSTCVLSLISKVYKDSITLHISKGTHDYPSSNFSRSDGHDMDNTDVFVDQWFALIVGPQHVQYLEESSTSAI
jgi:hypothetical protein